MRPEKNRQTSKKTAIARGRMFLKADLRWLPGFPVQQQGELVEWLILPRRGDWAPQTITLNRHHLHRATYTWSKLIHRFPKELPDIVEDRDCWAEGVPYLLKQIKRAVHE
ncbi:MAG: hypothetical protein AAF485_28435, partial [Chloroflexota bacterium]